MKKLVVALVLFVLALAGCDASAEALTKPNELTINGDYVVPPTTHGNPYAGGFIGGGVEPYLYDTLFVFSAAAEGEQFVPHLAESYVQEGKQISIKLKEGLTWSDGTPLMAQDVADSYYMWVGKKEIWQYLDNIEIVDDYNLNFNFMVESDLMMNLLCDVRIEAVADYSDWAREYEKIATEGREWHPETNSFWYTQSGNDQLAAINETVEAYQPDITTIVTSGAFTVKNVTTSELLLTKNTNFWTETNVDTLKIVRVITPETAAAAMVDGTLDLHSGGMNADLNNQVSEKLGENFNEFFIPEYSQMSIIFNLEDPIVSKKEFREAVGYLIPKEEVLPLAEVGSLPSEQGASGLPVSLQEIYGLEDWAKENTHNFEYDPEKAAEILTEAGWTKNDAGLWMTPEGDIAVIELSCNNGWGSAIIPGEAISNSLTEFGFDVTFKPMEGAAYDEYITSGEHQVAIEFAPTSNILYAHPYGTYQQLYKGRSWLFGLQPDENGSIFLENPEGELVDVIALTNKLFFAQSEEELTELTQELMTITDYNVLFIPYLEKGFPVRTLKQDIDFGFEDESLVIDERFSGVDSTTFSRLIIEGELAPRDAE